jgi:hypothetical protein
MMILTGYLAPIWRGLPVYTPKEVAENYLSTCRAKAALPLGRMFLLACLAGAFVALAGVASTAAAATVGDPSLAKLVSGCVFPAGLAMVIVAGSELFTGNNLMIMGVLSRVISARRMLRNWSVVYLGNFVGAALVAALAVGLIACRTDANRRQTAMDANYRHAYGEVLNAVQELDSSLQKSLYATTAAMECTVCTDIYSNAQTAEMACCRSIRMRSSASRATSPLPGTTRARSRAMRRRAERSHPRSWSICAPFPMQQSN